MTMFSSAIGQISRGSVVLALFAPLFVSSAASAEVACGETTCPQGFVCETQPAPCPAIACAEGQECPPCDATMEVCAPASCTSQADCGADMVCAGFDVRDCGGSAPAEPCERGEDCAAPAAPAECSSTTAYECTPRWQLPCAADADCGAGFRCVELESCSCAGSPAAPGGSGGGAEPAPGARAPSPAPVDPDADPSCVCEPSGQKSCEVVETACATNAECAAGWTCQDNPEGVCWADANGQTGCTPADPARLCAPPYSNLPVAGGFGEGRPTTGGIPANGGPQSGDGGGLPASGQSEEDGAGAQASGGGCSISAVPKTDASPLAWLGVALGAAVGLRRRARR